MQGLMKKPGGTGWYGGARLPNGLGIPPKRLMMIGSTEMLHLRTRRAVTQHSAKARRAYHPSLTAPNTKPTASRRTSIIWEPRPTIHPYPPGSWILAPGSTF
jgi:hypothetical protein